MAQHSQPPTLMLKSSQILMRIEHRRHGIVRYRRADDIDVHLVKTAEIIPEGRRAHRAAQEPDVIFEHGGARAALDLLPDQLNGARDRHALEDAAVRDGELVKGLDVAVEAAPLPRAVRELVHGAALDDVRRRFRRDRRRGAGFR